MRTPVRIGAVNYLNTKPLIYDLEALAPEAELSLDVPSRLADLLAAGQLDVALIPVIEYFRGDGYSVVPDIAIASRGPVLSVTLFSRVPWPEIRRWLSTPARGPAPPWPRSCFASATAYNRKSDHCRSTPKPRTSTPTQCCSSATGPCRPACPVSATASTWARNGCDGPGCRSSTRSGPCGRGRTFAAWMRRCRKQRSAACENVGPIAETEAGRLGLDAGFCRRYLESIIRFDLGPENGRRAAVLYAGVKLGLPRPIGAAFYKQWPTDEHGLEDMDEHGWLNRVHPCCLDPRSSVGHYYSGSRGDRWTCANLEKAAAGERLTFAEAHRCSSSTTCRRLGRAADAVTRRLHPEPYRTYNIDRNINYTNVCAAVCDFCAFYRKSNDADAYVLPREELYQKIEETIALGGDQILMQGGNCIRR